MLPLHLGFHVIVNLRRDRILGANW